MRGVSGKSNKNVHLTTLGYSKCEWLSHSKSAAIVLILLQSSARFHCVH